MKPAARPPSGPEFGVLMRTCMEVRRHSDPNFKRPHRTSERVQERYVHSVHGVEIVLEVYAHGLQALMTKGWFYVLPTQHGYEAANDDDGAQRGALTVYEQGVFDREIISLKMLLSA